MILCNPECSIGWATFHVIHLGYRKILHLLTPRQCPIIIWPSRPNPNQNFPRLKVKFINNFLRCHLRIISTLCHQYHHIKQLSSGSILYVFTRHWSRKLQTATARSFPKDYRFVTIYRLFSSRHYSFKPQIVGLPIVINTSHSLSHNECWLWFREQQLFKPERLLTSGLYNRKTSIHMTNSRPKTAGITSRVLESFVPHGIFIRFLVHLETNQIINIRSFKIGNKSLVIHVF